MSIQDNLGFRLMSSPIELHYISNNFLYFIVLFKSSNVMLGLPAKVIKDELILIEKYSFYSEYLLFLEQPWFTLKLLYIS